jgi:membrane protein
VSESATCPIPQQKPVSVRAIWELIKATACRWNEINAPRLGAALSFYTMLSVAPLLVVSVGIAGFVFGQEATQAHVAQQIQNLVGTQGGEAILSMLKESSTPSGGLAAAAIGVFMLLFGASGVFGELRDSLNLVWGVKSASGTSLIGMIKYRFVSFAMVLGIGFLLMVSLLLTTAISAAGKFFTPYLPASEVLLQIGNVVVSFLAVTILFALLYKVVPDVHIEWQDVWIGAAVTSLMFSIGKALIGLYLGKASVGSAYGAAGSLVVFLVWVYYSAQIFFLGAQFTHTFAEQHGSRARARSAVAVLPEKPEIKRFRHPKLA